MAVMIVGEGVIETCAEFEGYQPLTYREASWVDCGAPLAPKTSIRIIRGLVCALAAPANGLDLAFRQSTGRMVPHNWFLGIYLQAWGRRLIGSSPRGQTKRRIASFVFIEKRASPSRALGTATLRRRCLPIDRL